jgi:large subunit ribosomal protein L7A
VEELAEERAVELEYVDSMKELGLACNIDVGAATAVITQ